MLNAELTANPLTEEVLKLAKVDDPASELKKTVMDALRNVYEPEIAADLIFLELITEDRVVILPDNHVDITCLVFCASGCGMETHIFNNVIKELQKIEEIEKLTFRIDPFTEYRMPEDAKMLLGM